jgi:ABC-type sugar transport system permease subunit
VFWLTTIALNLVVFTLLTLMCHGELYARRPSPRRLTEFYLCTSFGGVIGGAFAGLLAPQIFNGNYEYPILIALALLCTSGMFAGGARKALISALPWLAISAVLALVWSVTRYQPPATLELATVGIVMGAGLGIPLLAQDWLGEGRLAMGVLIFIVSWQFVPFHSLLYQGAIRQIPQSLYEAAQLDGAGRVRQFWSITLPTLRYTIVTSSTLMVVGSLTFFDLIWILTAGGPGDSTRVLALDMYIRGFRGNQMGPASVIAVILVLIGLGLSLLFRRIGGGSASDSQLEGA